MGRPTTCSDSTWICASWYSQAEEWQPQSVYRMGSTTFVTVRTVDGRFIHRFQVSCPAAALRMVWSSSGDVDTVSFPKWLPMTDPSEQALWSGLFKTSQAVK
jgi:hypothetical protein